MQWSIWCVWSGHVVVLSLCLLEWSAREWSVPPEGPGPVKAVSSAGCRRPCKLSM